MSELHATFTLLLAEVNLMLLIVGGIVAAVLLGRRQRDAAEISRLVTRLKAAHPARLDAHRQALAACGLAAGEAQAGAQELTRAEDQFFRAVLASYMQRDGAATGQLDKLFAAAVAPYRKLTGGANSGGMQTGEKERLQRRIAELEADNQLRQETALAPDTIGQESDLEAMGMPEEPAEPPVEETTADAADALQDPPEAASDTEAESDAVLKDLNLDDIDLGLDDDARQAG